MDIEVQIGARRRTSALVLALVAVGSAAPVSAQEPAPGAGRGGQPAAAAEDEKDVKWLAAHGR
jgi:hypothetical protein